MEQRRTAESLAAHQALAVEDLERSTLAEIGRVATGYSDFGDIFDSVAEAIARLIPCDRIEIAGIDTVDGRYQTRFVFDAPLPGFAPSDERDMSPHILGGVDARSFSKLHTFDSEGRPDVERSTLATDFQEMSCELRARGEAVGILRVRSAIKAAYNEHERGLLEKIVAQISGAFANSELHAAAERRALEESVMALISRHIGESSDLETALDHVMRHVIELVHADRVSIALKNDETGIIDFLYESDSNQANAGDERRTAPVPGGNLERTISSGESVLVSEITEPETETQGNRALYESGYCSTLIVPLTWDGVTFGAVGVSSVTPNIYGRSQLLLMERIAIQIASWLATARMHDHLERQAQIDALMARISRDINSSLEIDRSLATLKDLIGELIPVDRIGIALRDETSGRLQSVFTTGVALNPDIGSEGSSPDMNRLSDHVMSTEESLFSNDLTELVVELPGIQGNLDAGIRSVICVPMKTDGKIGGVFGICSVNKHAYKSGDLGIVERVVSQVSGSIFNSQLHRQLEQSANLQITVSSIGRNISEAQELDSIYDRLPQEVGRVIPFDRFSIASFDADNKTAKTDFVAGIASPRDVPGTRFTITDELAAHIQNRKCVIVPTPLTAYQPPGPLKSADLRSGLLAPLIWRGDIVGWMSFRSIKADRYTNDHMAAAELLAPVIAGALVNYGLRERSERRADEERILARIGRVVNSSADIDEVYEQFARLASELVHADRILLTSFDGEDHFRERYFSGTVIAGRSPGQRFPLAGSLTGHIAERRKRISWSFSRDSIDIGETLPVLKPVIDDGILALVSVPLIIRDKVIGVLHFNSITDDPYTAHEQLLAEAVADQIAGAITNAELIEKTEEEARERTVLAEIGRLLGSSMEIDELCQTLANPLGLLIPHDRLAIFTYDEYGAAWHLRHADDIWENDPDLVRIIHDGSKVSDRLIRTRLPVRIDDHSDIEDEFRSPAYPGVGLRSSLLVPIIARDRLIGTIVVHSSRPNAFTEHHIYLGDQIARQIAGPLESAVLREIAVEEARYSAVLAEISRLVGSTLDLSEIYAGIADQIAELLPSDRLSLAIIDQDERTLKSLIAVGRQVMEWGTGSKRPLAGTVADEAITAGRGISVRTSSNADLVARYPGLGPISSVMDVRSLLVVPLFQKGVVFGVMHLTSEIPDIYSESDIELAERIAAHLSGGIVNADLFAQVETQARQRDLLAEIGRIAGSTLDLEELWPRLIGPWRELFAYDRLSVTLFDRRTFLRAIAFADGIRIPGADKGDPRPLDAPAAIAIGQLKSFVVHDALSDVESGKLVGALSIELGIRSMTAAPILFNAELVGSIDIKSSIPGTYSTQEAELLERVAELIAGAIANARLHSSVTVLAREEQLFSSIGRAVSASLDFSDSFVSISESVKQLVPYDRFTILGLDSEFTTVTRLYVAGVEVPGLEVGLTLPVSEWHGIARDMPHEGVIFDLDPSTSRSISREIVAGLPGFAIVPLIWNDKPVGAIALRSTDSARFTPHHLELLGRVARQIVGAFVNTSLHATTAKDAVERRALAEIGRAINMSMDQEDMFKAISDHINELIPFDRLVVTTIDGQTGDWVVRFASGHVIPGFQPGDHRTRHPLFSGSNTEPALFNGDEDSQMLPGGDDTGLTSAILVPLLVNGEKIGAFTIRSHSAYAYSSDHVDLAQRIASQISGAVANAELHAITLTEAEERATLTEIGRLVSLSLDLAETLDSISDQIQQLVPYDRLTVVTLDPLVETWTVRYVKGVPINGYELGQSEGIDSPFAWDTNNSREPIIETGDEESPSRPILNEAGLSAALQIPLFANNVLVGVLSLRSRDKNVYMDRHSERGKRIADQLAGNLANSELHRTLTDNEARNRAVLERAGVGIVTADASMIIETVNEQVLATFGYNREQLIGKNLSFLAAEPFKSQVANYVERYERTGETRIIGSPSGDLVSGLRSDGTTFPMELEITQVELVGGKTYTGIIRDITTRKEAENEILELTTNLERRVEERTSELKLANAELESFSFMVSHDLRGPLSMSANLANKLLEADYDVLSENSKTYVELIARSSRDSSRLVGDLLEFARLGHQPVTVARVDPGDIAILAQAAFAEEFPDVKWILGDMPPCHADGQLLRQVFTNLISNAYKFTAHSHEPSVEVSSTIIDNEIVYFVRDNGVGFDMSKADTAFKVFERLHRPSDYPGTGAGLAIVKRIIDRHGGRIWVDAVVDEGATFFFTLPDSGMETG